MIISDKLINFSEKNREENLEKIRQILLEGAIQQMQLESISNSPNYEKEYNENKLEFFDI
jgi:hypothetical protein